MILPYPPLLMPLQSKGLAPTRYPHLPPPHDLTPTRRSPLPFAMPPPAASHLQGLLLVTSQARNQTSDWLFPRHYCTTRKSFSNFCTFYHFFLTCGCSFSLASELKGKGKHTSKLTGGKIIKITQNILKHAKTSGWCPLCQLSYYAILFQNRSSRLTTAQRTCSVTGFRFLRCLLWTQGRHHNAPIRPHTSATYHRRSQHLHPLRLTTHLLAHWGTIRRRSDRHRLHRVW